MAGETLCESWRRLFTVTLVHAAAVMLGGLSFGYTMAFSLPAVSDLKADWNWTGSDDYWDWFTSITSLCAIPGAAAVGALSRCLRRRALLFGTALFGLGTWLGFLGCARARLWLGLALRGLSGVAIGAFSVLVPVSLVELSPPESTGFFGALNQLAIAAGFVVCYGAATVLHWRALVGIGAGIPGLLACLVWFIPESPAAAPRSPIGLTSSLASDHSLRDLLIGIGLMFFQQTAGINVALRYNVDAAHPMLSASFIQLAHVVSCAIGAFWIERVGRRMMWAVSLLVCAVANGLYALTFAVSPAWVGTARGVIIFVFLGGYGLGAGPIPWFFAPERFATPIRAYAAAIIAVVNWVFAFSVICLLTWFPTPFQQWEAAVAFAAFSVVGGITGLFFVRNPDAQARRAQVLHSEIDLFQGLQGTS
jgi:MFS family permease